MKASIAGRIRNTNLPKAKALLPLFEAVMNAFQAIEEVGGKGHYIRIVAERGSLRQRSVTRHRNFWNALHGMGNLEFSFPQSWEERQSGWERRQERHGGRA